jgi:hypothetical protein
MHIVKINGGLGNQMFQYAFALMLDQRYGDARLDLGWIEKYPAHNGYELDSIFRVSIPTCTSEERERLGDVSDNSLGKLRRRLRLTKRTHYSSSAFGYDSGALERAGDAYYSGYWQSFRYFEGREETIRDAFTFTSSLGPKDEALLASLSGRTSVGIHVRRGDFLRYHMASGICGEDYYERAIAAALVGAHEPILVFFSDDLDWCKERLRAPCEAAYVDWNAGKDSHADMRLMSLCDALVIANSSFSWWGAWLGKPDRKIFAPARWLAAGYRDNKDIAPPTWIRVPREA